MKKIFSLVSFISFLIVSLQIKAQPFADEIAAFKKVDSVSYPFKNQHPILFVGSSSFRKWDNIQGYFPGYPILNRGFGGSTLPDLMHYINEIIVPYYPKEIIIYCGENDLASPDSILAKTVVKNFKKLYRKIKIQLPYTFICFVSIKPSPSRPGIQSKVKEANAMIKRFLRNKPHNNYIDIYSVMLNADGSMRTELFAADNLHMNEKGYAIWQKIIEPYLIR